MLHCFSMLYLILWGLNAFTGAYGDICESTPLQTCHELLYSSNVFSIEGFPNIEQIKSLCPSAYSYLKCIEEYKTKCDFDEFGIFSTEQEFTKVQDFINDICNTDSTLHKNYAENIECLLSLKENFTECFNAAENIHHNYVEFKKNYIPERDEPFIANNVLCVSKSYIVMCAAMKSLTLCGPQAYDISREVINRSNLLQNFCKRMELYDLRTSFMDFLGADDEQRELMISVLKP